MQKHYNYLDIDLDSKNYRKLRAMQGDIKSRYILVNLYSNNLAYDLSHCTVKIYGLKRDKTIFFNNAVVKNAKLGQFEIELTNQALAVPGELKVQILVLGTDGEKLTSSAFFIDVGESIIDENAIESTNEFGALTESLTKVNEWNGYFEETSGKIEEKYTERLNNFDSQLEHNEKKIEVLYQKEVNVKDYGAKGDGVTDDTESIRNAIEYCKTSGINNLVIPPGDYMVDCCIKWDEHTPSWLNDKYHAFMLHDNLNVFMQGATLKCITNSNDNYIMFRIENCSNVNIEGGTLIGDRFTHGTDTGEWGYGIAIRNAKNITINNLTSRDFWGDGLYISNIYSRDEMINNIEIRNCIFDNNRRQGISISGGENIKILNCSMINTNGSAPESGIDIEPDDGYPYVKNLLIAGCYFDNNKGNAIESWINMSDESEDIIACEDVIVSNCIFTKGQKINYRSGRKFKILNCVNPALDCQFINGLEVSNNNVNIQSFCNLHSVNRVKINGNTHVQDSKIWGIGVNLVGTCVDVEISSNSFKYVNHPIQLNGGHTNISILNNDFVDYVTGIEMMALGVSNVNINGNFFKGSSLGDLSLGGSNIVVSNNTFNSFETKCFVIGSYKTDNLTVSHNVFNDTSSPVGTPILSMSGSNIKVLNNVINSIDTKVFLNTAMDDKGVLVCYNVFTFNDVRNWHTNNKDLFIDNYMPTSTL